MPEFDKDCSQAYLKVERGSGASDSLKRRSAFCRVPAVLIIAPFLLLLALQVASFYWLLAQVGPKPQLTAVIDLSGTRNCSKGSGSTTACKKGSLFIPSNDPIGPLRCHDDAYAHSRDGPNNCQGNQFRIAKNGLGVVIPKDGLYRLYAKVAYYDSIAHHTSMQVRIDSPQQTECLGNHDCLAAREKAAHAWLTCQAHQPPASRDTPARRDFSSCAVDGIRRFSAGETVGLQVSIGYRGIVGDRKATYLYIHML